MKDINILDLFSGIGGFSKGFIDAGFKINNHYFSEIDKHAIANYKYNFKNAEYIGSVEHVLSSRIERPNIITFGSPCQDFSLAGLRKGLSGDRSSLIEYAIAAVSHFRPDVFIWENVKGAFSSNGGADFWSIIKQFANIGGYDIEWQLVNTSWILPQNRERVYLVGHLSDPGGDWEGVFPIESEGSDYLKVEKSRTTDNIGTIIACYGKRPTDGQYIVQRFDGELKTRMLTEIECERLQGFPDNWTMYGDYDGVVKTIPKGQRYKLIGNAVTARIVELIASRIKCITKNKKE